MGSFRSPLIVALSLLAFGFTSCAACPPPYFIGDWEGGGERLRLLFEKMDRNRNKVKAILIGNLDDAGSERLPLMRLTKEEIGSFIQKLLCGNIYAYRTHRRGNTFWRYQSNYECAPCAVVQIQFDNFTVYIGFDEPPCEPALVICKRRNPQDAYEWISFYNEDLFVEIVTLVASKASDYLTRLEKQSTKKDEHAWWRLFDVANWLNGFLVCVADHLRAIKEWRPATKRNDLIRRWEELKEKGELFERCIKVSKD